MKVLFTTTSIMLALVLSLSLASCGGSSDKNSGSSSSSDKEGPASAPKATRPQDAVFGTSYNLSIVCNEAGEVVSITGNGIDPDPQTHTCRGSGPEDFSLSLKQGVNLSSPNNLTLSSKDENGNSADKTTMVDVPIDTLSILVSIDGDSLLNIDASNAQSFTVEGRCSEEGQPVVVSVGDLSPETNPVLNPDCTSNSWFVNLDVTSLNKATDAVISITADHSSSDGESATQALKEVTNSFLCPENFVAVPSLKDYTTNSFCVMKYEAKKDGSGNAISQPTSYPYRYITRDDSITKCQDIDTGYDLITNDEWQSIARNIEFVTSNWANGTVGDEGGLSVGHTRSSVSTRGAQEADSDDNNACHATEETCDSNTWNSQRRTHTLSNGEVVWDIGGNVQEWVKDDNLVSHDVDVNRFLSQVTDLTHPRSVSLSGGTTTTSRRAKGHFGPSGDYTKLDSEPFGGFGISWLNAGPRIIRGGKFATPSSQASQGVFTTELVHSMLFAHDGLGFRCAYHPPY